MIARLAASALTVSLALSLVPTTLAATPPSVDTMHLCQGTGDRVRARCITDAIKTLKEIERDYNEWEDDEIAAWKETNKDMGIGPEYQRALRTFLTEMRAKRLEFRKDLQAFRKAFFDAQKSKRLEGDSTDRSDRSPIDRVTEKSRRKAAEAICGIEDDDGEFRVCMRVQLRKELQDVSKRSRTNSRVIHQQ